MLRCMSVVLRFSDFRSDKRGVVAVMLALALLPMLICVGLAIDYGRMLLYQADLQYAADEAALAGAASFFDASEAMDAQDIATNFFYSQFNDLPPERLINLTMTLDPDATITTTHGPSSARTVTVTADTTDRKSTRLNSSH